MFTVVIAEKEHLHRIEEYSVFLNPLLDKRKFVFCEWHIGETGIEAALPQLYEAVDNREEWRAVVVCDNGGLHFKNPYDRVQYRASESDGTGPELYEAYEKAAKTPLVRLADWFCERPTVTGGTGRAAAADPDYAAYLARQRKKQEVLDRMAEGQLLRIAKPREVICLAERCYAESEYDIRNAWKEHNELQYSRFYDYNLYPEKLRYLVYDILPENHSNYDFDYLRFLSVLLLVAGNATPQDVLKPRRVYRVTCENDEQALSLLLRKYDSKLRSTSAMLTQRIEDIKKQHRRKLTGKEVASAYTAEVYIPLSFDSDFERDALFTSSKGLGLSRDCPVEEYGFWDSQYQTSRKEFARFLKQPRRALKRAASGMRAQDTIDSDDVFSLDEFQVEDICEYIDEQEKQMVSTRTGNLYDTAGYTRELEDADREVKRKIETRMTRNVTIGVGAAALVCYLLGFLPLIFRSLQTRTSAAVAGIMTGACLLLLALVGIGALFVLRRRLRNRMRHYNYVMSGIVGQVEQSMAQFARYLTHACSVMRAFSVVNTLREREDARYVKCKVLANHRRSIDAIRSENSRIFSRFLREDTVLPEEENPYDYDFSRIAEYTYPLPLTEANRRRIPYLQNGVYADISVDYISSIMAAREELYD